ncbi:MAG: exonuclease SbcCD subunit D [Chloroflexi bacterium]|nr:exonuclease SbcCD subunit D [Chloroflexota bacterium]
MLTVLHFADAHIDIANYGRRDPETGLPVRVMDFLRSLDTLVETALNERVDLVIFAGDAFKDRSPAPTFLREWAKRIMRLARARIPTVLVVGNHDLSPALGRAHALEVFKTFETPYVRVVDRPQLLGPEDLFGLDVWLIGIPWLTATRARTLLDLPTGSQAWQQAWETYLRKKILDEWLPRAQAEAPNRPILLAAHARVPGAQPGIERNLSLDQEFLLPMDAIRDPRLAYVALGHVHRYQNLNPEGHPPVVYAGSIERVDFAEADHEKGFVMARIHRAGNGFRTEVSFRPFPHLRPFIQRYVRLTGQEADPMAHILHALGPDDALEGAVVRLVIEYPRGMETLLDEARLRAYARRALHLRIIRRPVSPTRMRLSADQPVSQLSHLDLMALYWRATGKDEAEISPLLETARIIWREVTGESDDTEAEPG